MNAQNTELEQIGPNDKYVDPGIPKAPQLVANQSNSNPLPSEQLGACGVKVTCPYCNKEVETEIKNNFNLCTCLCKFTGPVYVCMWCGSRVCKLCGGGVFNIKECLCGWFCCCDADHSCPSCQGNIGHYNSTPHC